MHGEAAAAAAGHRHEARARLNKQQEQMQMTSAGSVWSPRMGTAGGGRRSCSLPPPVLTTTELSPHSSGSLSRSVLLFGSLLVKEAATLTGLQHLTLTLTGHSHCACHLNTTEPHTDSVNARVTHGLARKENSPRVTPFFISSHANPLLYSDLLQTGVILCKISQMTDRKKNVFLFSAILLWDQSLLTWPDCKKTKEAGTRKTYFIIFI